MICGDAAPLVGTEARELAGRAVGIQPVNAARDEPIDVPAEFRLVDFARLVLGHQVGCKDASQPFLVRHRRFVAFNQSSSGAVLYNPARPSCLRRHAVARAGRDVPREYKHFAE